MSAAQIQISQSSKLTLTEVGHETRSHPSAANRWVLKGVVLSTGERLKLKATRTPGAWLVEREDLNEFLERLTADRTGSTAATTETQKAPRSQRVERMRAGLAAAGF